MSEMSICLCFSYFTPAYYLCALFLVPEQAGALFMHQNPNEQTDGDCPKKDTVQGCKTTDRDSPNSTGEKRGNIGQ